MKKPSRIELMGFDKATEQAIYEVANGLQVSAIELAQAIMTGAGNIELDIIRDRAAEIARELAAGAEPTAPGGDASSADGQNADQKGTE